VLDAALLWYFSTWPAVSKREREINLTMHSSTTEPAMTPRRSAHDGAEKSHKQRSSWLAAPRRAAAGGGRCCTSQLASHQSGGATRRQAKRRNQPKRNEPFLLSSTREEAVIYTLLISVSAALFAFANHNNCLCSTLGSAIHATHNAKPRLRQRLLVRGRCRAPRGRSSCAGRHGRGTCPWRAPPPRWTRSSSRPRSPGRGWCGRCR
jgi:hypothetical protein